MSTLIASNLQASGGGGVAATLSSLNGGPLSGARNRIINGDFKIWQRGTSFSNIVSYTYIADRFVPVTSGGNTTVTQDTSVPNAQFRGSLKLVPAATATYTECVIRQLLEQQNIDDFLGSTVTASAWVKCSKTSVKMRLASQNATGGGDQTATISITANTWTKINYTYTTAFGSATAWTSTANASGGFLDIGFVDSTALTAADSLLITGVQLEAGSVATPFERRSYAQELELALRYYESQSSTTISMWPPVSNNAANIAARRVWVPYVALKRATPTITVSKSQGLTSEGIFAYTNGFHYSGDQGAFLETSVTSWTASAEL